MAGSSTKVGNLRGPKGDKGDAVKGDKGDRGPAVFSGNGAPSAAVIAAAVAGQDSYIDLASGDTYSFT